MKPVTFYNPATLLMRAVNLEEQMGDLTLSGSDRWDLRREMEDAFACAEQMEAKGVRLLKHVGPFGDIAIKPGDMVRIKRGAEVRSIGGHIHITTRRETKRVLDVTPGSVWRINAQPEVRNPDVQWIGSRGSYCWTDINNVELVIAQNPELPEVGSKWKAKDGRVIQVEEWVRPVMKTDQPRAKVTVLNPTRGMRRKTTFSLENFASMKEETWHGV